jgi:aconitate hydratase
MLGAGCSRKKRWSAGSRSKPWVKTSFAPGSKVVTDYIEKAGLWPYLESLRFNLVGYGCTTCIGNSGPLPETISKAIKDNNLVAVSVLSGNRNFEGRINPLCRANYLASPPLVVAYAIAGRMDFDIVNEPLGNDKAGKPVYLRDIWPTPQEVESTMRSSVTSEMFRKEYADVFTGDEHWRALPIPEGDLYAWDGKSTYIKDPPYFEGMQGEARRYSDLRGLAGARAVLGDSITTDHISPAGAIPARKPCGKISDRQRSAAQRTSIRTARAAATTK